MTQDEAKKLGGVLDEIAKLRADKLDIDHDINDAVASAAEKFGLTKRQVKQLAKERGMSDIEREAEQLHEEQMDQFRNSLGMLAGTALGNAAEAAVQAKGKKGKAKADAEWESAAPAGTG